MANELSIASKVGREGDGRCAKAVFLKLWVAKAWKLSRVKEKNLSPEDLRNEERSGGVITYVFKTKMKKIEIRFEVKTCSFGEH